MLANLTVTGPRYGPVRPDALPAVFWKSVPAERQPTLAEARENLERAMVRDALRRHRRVVRAARELGVTRQGLSKLMARLDIDRFKSGPRPIGPDAFALAPAGPARAVRRRNLRRRDPSLEGTTSRERPEQWV